MVKETAFWEAIVALAPLLGLTVVVELRSIRWHEYPRLLRAASAIVLCLALLGLSAATMMAITALFHWGEKPVDDFDTYLVLFSVLFAIPAVLIPPVSQTLYVIFGGKAGKVRRMLRKSLRSRKEFRTNIAALQAKHHELRLETFERIVANPERVFLAPEMRVQITDQEIVRLRRLTTMAELDSLQTQLRWLAWEKETRIELDEAEKMFGIHKRMSFIKRMQGSA